MATGEDLTTQLDLHGIQGAGGEERAYLMVRQGTQADVVAVEEGQDVVIGRGTEADVVVADARVSRRHSVLSVRGGVLAVRDLGGRNGTRVAGTTLRSKDQVVVRGQEIVVGPARITVVSLPRIPTAGASRGATVLNSASVICDLRMREVMERVRRIAPAPTSVLVLGETGVGKEVIASEIHSLSPRRDRPFVTLNCAAVPGSLLESELFGHERGAFTGATERKIGFFEAADGGTLFLDEIGDIPSELQAKLLRVLETHRIQRVGGREERAVDVRIICATHRDLPAMVAEQTFRQDLYYRIEGIVVHIPPLRDRPADIDPLADSFLRSFGERLGSVPTLSAEARNALHHHRWPGNVRELRNAIEHAAVLAESGTIQREHLPPAVVAASSPVRLPTAASGEAPGTMREHTEDAERRAVLQALQAAEGHRARTAEILGVSKRTLQYKLTKLGLKD